MRGTFEPEIRHLTQIAFHPERVKAEIRIHYGSLEKFADANGLKRDQVRDFLSRKSNAAKPAVARLLGVDPDHLVLQPRVPIRGTNKPRAGVAQ